MRWMKRRKNEPVGEPVGQSEGERKAEEALGESIMQFNNAVDHEEPVRKLSASLQRIRERNHFGEALEELFGGAK